MEVRRLNTISFEEVLACFLLAFENYYVKMPTDPDYFKQRWMAAKVSFDHSYGMFEGDHLVGFIIHALDTRNQVLTAFNTGTGVIPDYRGRRVIKAIYDFAIDDLKNNGIQKSTLEVITKNEKAIKAYEGVGFKICKDLACYAGKINLIDNEPVELRKVSMKNVDWEALPNQQYYSWDFQKETVLGVNYSFYEVMYKSKPESFFIINTENTYVAQFDVLNQESAAWPRLLTGIQQVSPEVKMINVDSRLTMKKKYIQLAGLKNTVDQYEMELDLIS